MNKRVISRTPLRCSFVGGGTDIESFYAKESGAVICTSIDKYIYVHISNNILPCFEIVSYYGYDNATKIETIRNPFIKETLKLYNLNDYLKISIHSDVPPRIGLGSSSSLTVGLITALERYTKGEICKKKIAEKACFVEIKKMNRCIGKQDQFAVAIGGMNHISFFPNELVNVETIHLSRNQKSFLFKKLLFFYTGGQRDSTTILQKQSHNDPDTFKSLTSMKKLTYTLKDRLLEKDYDFLGQALHFNWILKKRINPYVTNPLIDFFYGEAIKSGAIGGKILGAGLHGIIILFCKENQDQICKLATKVGFARVFISFEEDGSKIIYDSGLKG
jgi:D-glycero-alpha-D-manno-heptose-7-phosphate kinase